MYYNILISHTAACSPPIDHPLSRRSRNPFCCMKTGNRSVKPWSPSAFRGRRSEQNRRIACDCRHLQPRPGPRHHGLTELLQNLTADAFGPGQDLFSMTCWAFGPTSLSISLAGVHPGMGSRGAGLTNTTSSFASVGAAPNSRSRGSSMRARSQEPRLRGRWVRRSWRR